MSQSLKFKIFLVISFFLIAISMIAHSKYQSLAKTSLRDNAIVAQNTKIFSDLEKGNKSLWQDDEELETLPRKYRQINREAFYEMRNLLDDMARTDSSKIKYEMEQEYHDRIMITFIENKKRIIITSLDPRGRPDSSSWQDHPINFAVVSGSKRKEKRDNWQYDILLGRMGNCYTTESPEDIDAYCKRRHQETIALTKKHFHIK